MPASTETNDKRKAYFVDFLHGRGGFFSKSELKINLVSDNLITYKKYHKHFYIPIKEAFGVHRN